ncbi:MAG: relaxase/mobilization nuclease domain-containing protein, partial [Monoglobaceae bacterium]
MLAYVTNEEKTENTLVTGLNCSTKYNDAYEDMKFNFEMYSGERFFKRSIKSDTAKRERQKIRLHHYIQSFKPGEVTPEEAHQIGVEWAEKVFGKKHMVLCATHTDRGHIHNHFAVCPYDMYGKHWYANKKSMRMCRAISDEIALAHGLEIIEHPKKSYCHKYGEYKARKEGRSWKQKLCDDIDNAIMKDNVRSVDDLLKELMKQGYGIKRGKYISIKVKQNRKPIRSFRLGDGYALEHLEYRINHKNYEMPLSEAMKYSGIQREYALCIRQIQIQLYRCPEPERLHIATYREVERSSRLLFYLQEKQIHSAEDFQKAVAAADERAEDLKNQKAELVQKISDTEKMIEEIPQYLEILNRRPLMPNDIKELSKFTHLKDIGVI